MSSQFRCISGQCIKKDQQCDNFENCLDKSDENPFICKTIRCEVPRIPNGKVLIDSLDIRIQGKKLVAGRYYGGNDNVFVTCSAGFHLFATGSNIKTNLTTIIFKYLNYVDDTSISCKNSKWTKSFPECVSKEQLKIIWQ